MGSHRTKLLVRRRRLQHRRRPLLGDGGTDWTFTSVWSSIQSRRDSDAGIGLDHLPAFRRDVDVGEPGRHGSFSRLAVPGPLHGSGFVLGPLAADSGRRSTRNGQPADFGAGRESGATAKGTGLNRAGLAAMTEG